MAQGLRGVYYNENDRAKAAWLRHLIEDGQIARGHVDERSITEVPAEDLAGFAQHHFFAGVGVWSLAARLAGWPDDRPIWTGSCPCGPFSIAGKRKGFEDPRHLWPAWFRLIGERRPDVLFGEQSDQAHEWVDLVSSDLEAVGYAFGALDLPAAGFGGAHERQRYFWMADADNAEWWSDRAPWHDGGWPHTGRVKGSGHARHGGGLLGLADSAASGRGVGRGAAQAERRSEAGHDDGGGEVVWMGYTDRAGERGGLRQEGGTPPAGEGEMGEYLGQRVRDFDGGRGVADGLGDASSAGLSDAEYGIIRRPGWGLKGRATGEPGDPRRPGVDWLFCRDGAWRPVESGSCPLVDATPARMGRLRGYGDAIDCEVATQFIAAYLEVSPCT